MPRYPQYRLERKIMDGNHVSTEILFENQRKYEKDSYRRSIYEIISKKYMFATKLL